MADSEIATATNRRIQISDAIYLRKKHATESKNKIKKIHSTDEIYIITKPQNRGLKILRKSESV